MKYYVVFGLVMEDIDVVVVEDSKMMQMILRLIFLSFWVVWVCIFDLVDDVLELSFVELLNVIIMDWWMVLIFGY